MRFLLLLKLAQSFQTNFFEDHDLLGVPLILKQFTQELHSSSQQTNDHHLPQQLNDII